MSNLDGKIVKEFCKLQEADKTEVITTMETLAAMTKEQHSIYNELMKKTILTIPEDDMNRSHADFITYAAEAVKEGATLPELLEDWQKWDTKGDGPATEPRDPESLEDKINADTALFNKIYHNNKTMEMLCNCENWFMTGNDELNTVIRTFTGLPGSHNVIYKIALKDAWQLLAALYNLGRIHGVRAERKRQQKRGKGHGTGSKETAGT